MSELPERTILALAEPTRLRIVDLLSERPHRAGDIAAALNMSGPATSRHLRTLRVNGLIEETHPDEDARVRVYRLRPEPFAALHSWVERIESGWSTQLDAFQRYVESVKDRP